MTEYTLVTVALAASTVTKVGPLTVHPSNEMGLRWAITSPCGMAAGKFHTRAAALSFAREVMPLFDWASVAPDVESGIRWAKNLAPELKEKIHAARERAEDIDVLHGLGGTDDLS